MLAWYSNYNTISLRDRKIRGLRHAAAGGISRRSTTRCCLSFSLKDVEGLRERIKEELGGKIELSVSAYDTAWVAMVPSRDSEDKPCFPQCLDWIMENQHQDGSWGLLPRHPLLLKDSLSCTLACVIALTKWRVGVQRVQRGLEFVGWHGSAATAKDQLCPIGFDIVFPSMMNEAIKLGLNMPFDQVTLDHMRSTRKSIMERNKRNFGVLAYVAEGLEESYPWEELKYHQRSNGSFFNSPATTAAAMIHHHPDHKCFEYLCAVLKEYKCGVPTVYPMDIYGRLCKVDTVRRLGIERHFLLEIETILSDTYRYWQLKSEEICLDVTCCAVAFRLLRLHGYEVSSDELERFSDQEQFFDTVSIQYTNIITVLELFRASALKIHQNETTLDKINAWTSIYLKQQVLDQKILDERLLKEVEFDLKNINRALERILSRQSIDRYSEDNFQILKTSYRCFNCVDRDFLLFSIHDFNKCQVVLKSELEQLERWFAENRLDQIKGTRGILQSSYFVIAADVFSPELSESRISYAQVVILVSVVDDLVDKFGIKEEMRNIIDLIKKWDEPLESDNCSNQVEIFYSALWKTTNQMAANASLKQGRCVKNDIIRLLLDVFESMMKELEWWNDGVIPTMEEYLSIASVSIACELVMFPALCSLGPELPEEVLRSKEYTSLMKHTSLIGRLINDLQTYKREMQERKVNSVSLQLSQGHDAEVTLEEAIENIKGMIENSRRELLRLVLQTKGSQVPKVCKDLCWTTSKILHFLYSYGDEFTSPKEIKDIMKTVIYEPIKLSPSMD